MKKTLWISAFTIPALVIILLLLPFVFKNQISERIKAEINEVITGRVDFRGVSVSPWANFPNPTISLNDLVITSSGDFKNDTLAFIQNFSFSVNLWSVITGKNYKVLSLSMNRPSIHLHVNGKGHANWDIMKTTIPISKEGANESSLPGTDFSLQIKNWKVEKAILSSFNDTSHSFWQLNGVNSHGLEKDNKTGYELQSETKIDELSCGAEGLTYLNKTRIEAAIHFLFDAGTGTYLLKDNLVQFNALQMLLDGTVKVDSRGTRSDLKLHAKDHAFKQILSLFPSICDTNYESMRTDGKFQLTGSIQGLYHEDQFPAMLINLNIEDGMFQKPGLPSPVRHIFVRAGFTKPQGPMDLSVVEVKRLRLETGKDSINGTAVFSNLATNPAFKLQVLGDLDLAGLSGFYRMEQVRQLSGRVHVDFKFGAHKKDLDNKNYRLVEVSGHAYASDINLENKEFPVAIHIQQASFTFHPEYISLDNLTGTAGKNDFSCTGKLEQVIPYIDNQGPLLADVKLTSDRIAVSELMDHSPKASSSTKSRTKTTKNSIVYEQQRGASTGFHLVIHPVIKRVEYDKLLFERLTGQVEINNDNIILKDVTATALGGTIMVNSQYQGEKKNQISFRTDVHNMDIQQVYRSIDELSKTTPSLQYISGNFSGELNGTGSLNADNSLNYNALNADAKISLPSVKIDELPVLMDIAKLAKVKSLEHLEAKNVATSFHFNNGETTINPTDIKFTSGYRINFKGKHSANQNIDDDLVLEVPVKEFGSVASLAQNLLSGFMKVPESMQFKFKISGKGDKPEVKVMGVATGE